MKIFVAAKPNAKEEMVEETSPTHFRVAVKEPPVQGRANAAIIKALAGHFGVSPRRVRLISGFASKNKMFEITQSQPKKLGFR